MQITINPELHPDTPTANSFEVLINTVDGDGDDYEDVTFSAFIKDSDEAALENIMSMLDRLKHARYDCLDFNHIEGFNDWFYADWTERYSDGEKSLDVAGHKREKQNWPMNPGDVPYSLDSVKVTYYDENRLPHKVEISL